MAGFIDEMLADIGRPKSKGIFDVAKGAETTLRFISDGDQGFKFRLHRRFLDGVENSGYKVPCPLAFGHDECPLCEADETEQNGRYTRMHYGFIVYNYGTAEIEVMYYAGNSKTPLEQIGRYFRKKGTLLGRDFTLSHNDKTGWDEAYNFTPDDPGVPEDKVVNVIKKKFNMFPKKGNLIDTETVQTFMKERIAKQLCPAVLEKPLVLPDNVLEEMLLPSAKPKQNGQVKKKDPIEEMFDTEDEEESEEDEHLPD